MMEEAKEEERTPVIEVDFNEMVSPDVVLVARDERVRDVAGAVVHLREGMRVVVCMEDVGDNGQQEYITASGTAARNTACDWSSHVPWCCQIDSWGRTAHLER